VITLEDCLGLCDLTPAEIAAIAEHEHVPEISAAALGDYLMHRDKGAARVRAMIHDDIRAAIAAGDARHARQLAHVFAEFLRLHPEAAGS
jgi:S-ribosylhomocysteine lyase LuxS involved in autoinducer biosynthesis